MPVLFFSGGLDSTILAADIARHPWRYGVEKDAGLLLLHVSSEVTDEKQKSLERLVAAISEGSTLGVNLDYVNDGLYCEPSNGRSPRGGAQSLSAILDRSPQDLKNISYTPGWMFWMAAMAVNLLAGVADESGWANPEQAFIAHQWNGPVWRALDRGEKLNYDCLPEFFEHANRAIKASNERVRIRVPFLENRMDREMVVAMGMELGLPLEQTSSCLLGWKRDCGLCAACILRHMAFKSVGYEPKKVKKFSLK